MFDIGNIQKFYDGAYEQMMPYANEVVGRFGSNRELSEAEINRMTDEILLRSNLKRFRPNGYNSSNMTELARLLLFVSLYNRGYFINPFWQLYFGNNRQFLLRDIASFARGYDLPRVIMPPRPPYGHMPDFVGTQTPPRPWEGGGGYHGGGHGGRGRR